MERQRTELRTAIGTAPCPTGKDADEIVVCARRGLDPHRLPLPSTRPGDRVAGELPSAVALTKEETCTNVGITRGCPSIDILGIGLMVGKVIVEQVAKKVAED